MPIEIFGPHGQDYKGQGLSIEGLQRAQERNLRRIVMMKPGGIRGQAVKNAAADFHAKLTVNTPVQWGALRVSRRITFNASVPRAQIFTSGNSYNPRSSTPPHVYDIYLHAMGHKKGREGGWTDSFPHTMRQHGQRIVNDMVKLVQLNLRNP